MFWILYIVHLTGGFVVVVLAKAGYRGHVVVIFALGASLVGRVLVGVLLYVFYVSLVSRFRVRRGGKTQEKKRNAPLTLAS